MKHYTLQNTPNSLSGWQIFVENCPANKISRPI